MESNSPKEISHISTPQENLIRMEDKYPLLIIHYQLMVPYVMKSFSSSEGLLLSISQEFVSLINFYITGLQDRG